MWLFPFCRISDCPFCSGGCFDCKPPHAWRVTMSPAGSTATTIGWRAKEFDAATGRAAPWLLKGEAILNWSLVSFWFMFFYWWIFSVFRMEQGHCWGSIGWWSWGMRAGPWTWLLAVIGRYPGKEIGCRSMNGSIISWIIMNPPRFIGDFPIKTSMNCGLSIATVDFERVIWYTLFGVFEALLDDVMTYLEEWHASSAPIWDTKSQCLGEELSETSTT